MGEPDMLLGRRCNVHFFPIRSEKMPQPLASVEKAVGHFKWARERNCRGLLHHPISRLYHSLFGRWKAWGFSKVCKPKTTRSRRRLEVKLWLLIEGAGRLRAAPMGQ